MIDCGISENYAAWWLEQPDHCFRDHIERDLRGAKYVVRCGAGGGSLVQIYSDALACYSTPALTAEYLRRALQELANPTPVDDGLPPPDSLIWEIVYRDMLQNAWSAALKQTPAHPQTSQH